MILATIPPIPPSPILAKTKKLNAIAAFEVDRQGVSMKRNSIEIVPKIITNHTYQIQ
jgi:hypothetical protein